MKETIYCNPPILRPVKMTCSAAYSLPITKEYKPSLERILDLVSEKTGISIERMKINSRQKQTVKARRIYYYNANKFTTASLTTLGISMGQDHVTVMFSLKKAKIDIEIYGEKELYELF